MLRSYARKSSQARDGGEQPEAIPEESNGGKADVVEGSRREGGFTMALSMDYEIVTPDGDLVESMGMDSVSALLYIYSTCV